MSAKRATNDSRHYYKWLSCAASDMRSATILKTYGGDAESIAFHCQQTIEKALKGYLLYKTGRHFDGHNLTFLCKQAAKEDPLFQEYLYQSAVLNQYYIESRYPTDLPFVIEQADVENIYSMASQMFHVIQHDILENDEDAVDVE